MYRVTVDGGPFTYSLAATVNGGTSFTNTLAPSPATLPSLTPWPTASSYKLAPPSAAPAPFTVVTDLGALPPNNTAVKWATNLPSGSEYHYYSFANLAFGGFLVSLVVAPNPAVYWAQIDVGTTAPSGLASATFTSLAECYLYYEQALYCTIPVLASAAYYVSPSIFYVRVTASGPVAYTLTLQYMGETPAPPALSPLQLLLGAPPIVQTALPWTTNLYELSVPVAGAVTISVILMGGYYPTVNVGYSGDGDASGINNGAPIAVWNIYAWVAAPSALFPGATAASLTITTSDPNYQGAGGTYVVVVEPYSYAYYGVSYPASYSLAATVASLTTFPATPPTSSPWPSPSSYLFVTPSNVPAPFYVVGQLGTLPFTTGTSLPSSSEYHTYNFTNVQYGGFYVSIVVAPMPAWRIAILYVSTSAPTGTDNSGFPYSDSCTVSYSGSASCTVFVGLTAAYFQPAPYTYYLRVASYSPVNYQIEGAIIGESPAPQLLTAGSLVNGAAPLIQSVGSNQFNTYRFVAPGPGPVTFTLVGVCPGTTCSAYGFVDTLDDTDPTGRANGNSMPSTSRWSLNSNAALLISTSDPHYQGAGGVYVITVNSGPTYALSGYVTAVATQLPAAALPTLSPWPSVSPYSFITPSTPPAPYGTINALGALPADAATTLAAIIPYHLYSFTNPLGPFTLSMVTALSPAYYYAVKFDIAVVAPSGVANAAFTSVATCYTYGSYWGGSGSCTLTVDTTAPYYSPGTTYYVRVSHYYGGAFAYTLLAAYLPTTASPDSTVTPSPSDTKTYYPTPSASPSLATPSVTLTPNSATATSTASPSPFCPATTYRTFSQYVMDGPVVAPPQPLASELACQRACCYLGACDGYTFNAEALLYGPLGTCFLLGNSTMLVPSPGRLSGVNLLRSSFGINGSAAVTFSGRRLIDALLITPWGTPSASASMPPAATTVGSTTSMPPPAVTTVGSTTSTVSTSSVTAISSGTGTPTTSAPTRSQAVAGTSTQTSTSMGTIASSQSSSKTHTRTYSATETRSPISTRTATRSATSTPSDSRTSSHTRSATRTSSVTRSSTRSATTTSTSSRTRGPTRSTTKTPSGSKKLKA